jgi:hypothetical protein
VLYPDNEEERAFLSDQGLWQFTVMPFGLCNFSATFGRQMKTIIKASQTLPSVFGIHDSDRPQVSGTTEQLREYVPTIPRVHTEINQDKFQFIQEDVRTICGSYHVVGGSENRHRENEGCVGMASTEGQAKIKERNYFYGKYSAHEHFALTWLMKFKNFEEKGARRIQRLQECNFIFEDHQGRK